MSLTYRIEIFRVKYLPFGLSGKDKGTDTLTWYIGGFTMLNAG